MDKDLKTAVNASLGAAKITEQAVGNISPKKNKGKPVKTSAASISGGVLQPQYAALRDEVTKDHPIMELSPEVKAMMAKAGQVTNDMLSGVISKDVESQISRIASEKAIRGGLGMSSQAARNLTARDLGLTSMDIQAKGIESARALADFDAGWQSQRMDYLGKMRQMDLSGKELNQNMNQFKQEMQLKRLGLLSDTMTNYYKLAFGYEGTKKASQANVNALRADLKGSVANRLTSILEGN
jgi:hypothetical protein